MASAGARAYNGGLGEPPARFIGRAPGQGVRGRGPPKLIIIIIIIRFVKRQNVKRLP